MTRKTCKTCKWWEQYRATLPGPFAEVGRCEAFDDITMYNYTCPHHTPTTAPAGAGDDDGK